MVATHDMEQTRAWDRVLCLNRRQVAFGPPADALTREVLERTYGGVDRDAARRAASRAACCPRTTTATRSRRDAPGRRRRGRAARPVAERHLEPCPDRGRAAGCGGRAARLLGRALRPLLQRRVARARAVPRPRDRCAGRLPAGARGGARCRWSRRPRSPTRPALGRARRRHRGRGRGHGAGRSSARCWRCRPTRPAAVQELLFGDVLARHRRATWCWPRPWPRPCSSRCGSRTAGCWSSASTARTPARSARRRPRSDLVLLLLVGGVHRGRGAGARQPARARAAGRAGRDRAPRCRGGWSR